MRVSCKASPISVKRLDCERVLVAWSGRDSFSYSSRASGVRRKIERSLRRERIRRRRLGQRGTASGDPKLAVFGAENRGSPLVFTIRALVTEAMIVDDPTRTAAVHSTGVERRTTRRRISATRVLLGPLRTLAAKDGER